MWLLRQNVQYNKRTFLQEIFFFVLLIHLVLLGLIFVCDTGKYHQEKFVVNTNNLQSTIVFMPLKKRVVDQNRSKKPSSKPLSDSPNRHIMNHDEYAKKLAEQEKNKKVEVKKEPVVKAPEKSVVKKEEKVAKTASTKKSPTRLQTIKEKKPAVKTPVKPVVKKPATKNEAVTATRKQIEEKKKAAESKKVVEEKKESQVKPIQPTVVPEKQEEVKAENSAPVQQEVVEKSVQQVEVVSEKADQTEDFIDLEHVSFVGSLDLEMMQIKEQIGLEIAKYYKPPVGISKKAVCEFTIKVGALGKADRVVVKKASGSVANDICARAALLKVTFPKEVIGKEIIVELGQS